MFFHQPCSNRCTARSTSFYALNKCLDGSECYKYPKKKREPTVLVRQRTADCDKAVCSPAQSRQRTDHRSRNSENPQALERCGWTGGRAVCRCRACSDRVRRASAPDTESSTR